MVETKRKDSVLLSCLQNSVLIRNGDFKSMENAI